MADVLLLEENMVNRLDWDQVPLEARRRAEEIQANGAPAGIAQHPRTKRWYVLESTGQGPYVVWEEEGQCEGCGGRIDDGAVAEWRSLGNMGSFELSLPGICTDCNDRAEREIM